jgi:hypothetical protein
MLNVAEVTGAIQRMEAGIGQFGRVADVMQPRCGFEQVGVIAEDDGERAGLRRDALDVRPAARQAAPPTTGPATSNANERQTARAQPQRADGAA